MDVLLKHLTDDAEQGKYDDSCLILFFSPDLCIGITFDIFHSWAHLEIDMLNMLNMPKSKLRKGIQRCNLLLIQSYVPSQYQLSRYSTLSCHNPGSAPSEFPFVLTSG